jgi:hypothetical protein
MLEIVMLITYIYKWKGEGMVYSDMNLAHDMRAQTVGQ